MDVGYGLPLFGSRERDRGADIMEGSKGSGRTNLYFMLLLLITAASCCASSAEEQQPQECWQHRVWGLRYEDRVGECSTAFVPTHYHLNRIASSSELRIAQKEDDNSNRVSIDREEEEEQSSPSAPAPSTTTFKKINKDEWIDGRQMMQLMELDRAREEQERQRQREMELFTSQFQPPQVSSKQGSNTREQFIEKSKFRSRISYTDANTLEIELPPPGVNGDTVFTGVFSAIWFSALGPATFGMLSSSGIGTLFMVPFWYAGGKVAKMAVVDPFISSKLSIGDYLWTLEKNYFQKRGKLTSKTKDGPTEIIQGASVEVGMVVNNVPRYELRLYLDDGTISFGNGLSYDELEYLAEVINDRLDNVDEYETQRLESNG